MASEQKSDLLDFDPASIGLEKGFRLTDYTRLKG